MNLRCNFELPEVLNPQDS